MEILLLIGCFLFVTTAVLAGGYWFLREPAPAPEPEVAGVWSSPNDGAVRQTLERIGNFVPAASDTNHPVRRSLAGAGYRAPEALAIFFGVKAVAAIAVGIILFFAGIQFTGDTANAFILGACGAGIGYFLPDRFLGARIANRRAKMRAALPAAVDLLVLSLEAGQGLDSAILDTSRELRGVYRDLSEELMLSHLEMRAGQSRAEVLNRLAQRTGEPEVKKLTNLLLDGDRFGTALGPALRNHARYTRLRRRQMAQEQARKTSVKLIFPVFFLIFPSVLLVTLGPAALKLMEGMGKLLGN